MKNNKNNETGQSSGMERAIKETCQQFGFKPEVVYKENGFSASKYVLIGMGGSHLSADLLKIIKPELDISIHRNYGLPALADVKERLVILSSYSGNTEEVLDAYEEAGKHGLSRAAISTGGELLERAKKDEIPYIQMPDFHIQPRSALPLSLLALLKITGEEALLKKANELHDIFHPEHFEDEGKALAEQIRGLVPIIYTSAKNEPLAYNWKIKFNETGKIPAFYNVFPEINHNEMTGFDVKNSTSSLSEKFSFIFLSSPEDHPKIQKRMEITAKLYEERGLPTQKIELAGDNVFHTIFNSLALADFTALFTALGFGLEPEEVPMIEEFKKRIAP